MGQHFLLAFFLVSFFLRPRRKLHRKKLAETQSMKIQVKSGEIPVRKNVGKMKQNVDSRRLTPKSAKLTCYPILKIQLRENTGKDYRYDRQVGSRASKRNISVVWNMGQFVIGQFWCRTSLAQHFGSLKLSDMKDVGPTTWAHINGYIDACKCTEIFIQQYLKVENQNEWSFV